MPNEKQLIPQLRFPEFNEVWTKNKVVELADYIVPGRNKPKKFNGGIPWITTPDIEHNGIVIRSKKGLAISREEAKKVGAKIVPTNSVIISCVGELGLTAITGVEMVINQQLHAFIPKEKIDNRFLLYSISNQKKYMDKVATKTAVPYMNKDNCNSIPVIYPILPEQQKIASFLSDVDKAIAKLTKKKTLLEQYKNGVMQKIFNQELRFKDDGGNEFPDWGEKTLKQLLKSYKLGGNYSNSDKITDRPLIKMGNLERGYIVFSKIQYIENKEAVDEDDKIKEGDLFFNTRNTLDLVGKVAIWKNELPLAYYNSNLMRFKFENNYFMNYRLNSYQGIKRLKRYATGTTSVAAIYTKDLLKLKLSIPCHKEQTRIANFLSDIDIKIEALSTKIKNSKTFKKGLLQQMFV